jgi:hypothetical protein
MEENLRLAAEKAKCPQAWYVLSGREPTRKTKLLLAEKSCELGWVQGQWLLRQEYARRANKSGEFGDFLALYRNFARICGRQAVGGSYLETGGCILAFMQKFGKGSTSKTDLSQFYSIGEICVNYGRSNGLRDDGDCDSYRHRRFQLQMMLLYKMFNEQARTAALYFLLICRSSALYLPRDVARLIARQVYDTPQEQGWYRPKYISAKKYHDLRQSGQIFDKKYNRRKQAEEAGGKK